MRTADEWDEEAVIIALTSSIRQRWPLHLIGEPLNLDWGA